MSSNASSLIRLFPSRARSGGTPYVRLFCFPYAGAGASRFSGWADSLPSWIQIAAIQLPGREDRWSEPSVASMAPIVEALSREIPRFLDLPIAIFGHSLGGLLGFEFGRLLERQFRLSPLQLVVSAVEAPSARPSRHPILHRMPDQDFLNEIIKLDGVPREVQANDELLALMLPVLRADVTMYETYRLSFQPPLSCPILVIGAEGDTRVSPASLSEWRRHTRNRCELYRFPGNHFYLHPHRDSLLGLIASRLGMTLSHATLAARA